MTDIIEQAAPVAEKEAPKAKRASKTVAAAEGQAAPKAEKAVKPAALKATKKASEETTEKTVKETKIAKKAKAEDDGASKIVEIETVVKAETPKTPKKAVAKKTVKAKVPLYINGRYVAEKALPEKHKAGYKPYELSKKKIKVTLVKSTVGCLDDQQRTVKALGLTKIRSTNVLPDNAAIRGMIFKVKHLVETEEVK